VTVLIFLAPAVATAQRQGAGPGPGAGQGATTLTTFQTNDFSGSGVCASCHSGLTDEATPTPNDVSNDAHWRSTMMANAAKDPLWQAKISSEVDRASHLKQAIEEKCSRCHMGMARYQQLADGATKYDIYVLDTGYLDPTHNLHEAAMDGVSCTLCHQVRPDGLGTQATYTGQYAIDTSTSPPDRLIFGPYDQVLQNPMQQNVGFLPTIEDVGKPHLTSSAHCGSCHTLYTPTLDANGDVVGEFPEQTTYLEWEHAGFGDTCQDCHLPTAVGAVVISNRPPRLAPRDPFWQHHFVGGNSYMVGLLQANADDLGVTADQGHLEDTINRTQALLAGETATLTVSAERAGNLLTVTVGVVNLAGHKLPSGLPSRRAWLHLLVTDGSNNVVFESGKPTGDGRIEGNAADQDLATWEPHYEFITAPDEVQIYEPIMLNTDGVVTYTLLRADSYVKDNRLLPEGFNKHNAVADIGVYGGALDDTDFVGGSDQVVYEVNIAELNEPLNVTAELLFQTLSYPFVTDLKVNPTQLVDRFMVMYDLVPNKEETLARAQTTVD
jgi:hypothetical protein